MKELTDKQQHVLDVIHRSLRERGQSPTVREIGDAVGVKSSCTVQHHLDALERKGHIQRDRYKYRSIELTSAPFQPYTHALNVPVLGEITAGVPMLAQENIEDTYPLPIGLVREGEEVFMLRVKGDSMIGAGIFDGDLVAIRKQETANNGEIVAALIEDEATIKRFYRDRGQVRLVAENPHYPPIIPEQCQVIGKVILSVRTFR